MYNSVIFDFCLGVCRVICSSLLFHLINSKKKKNTNFMKNKFWNDVNQTES